MDTILQFKPKQENLICSAHSKTLQKFCLFCKAVFCSSCNSIHNNHNSITISELLSQDCLNSITTNFQKAKGKINNYYSRIKDLAVRRLNECIAKIEKSFEENKLKNEKLLNYFTVLLNNYMSSKGDFFAAINVLNNSSFNYSKKENNSESENLQSTIDSLIEYFEEDSIINPVKISYAIKERYEVDMSNLKCIKTLSAHTNHVYSLLLLKDGRLCSCSYDDTIKIYNKVTYECELSLEGHSGSVWYISQMDDGKLLSCSNDCTVKVWEVYSDFYTEDATLKGHKNSVSKVIPLSDCRIASCSDDMTIKIWSGFQPYNLICTLIGQNDYISSIYFTSSGRLASGSYQVGKLLFWDLDKYTVEEDKTVNGVKCWSQNSLKETFSHKMLVGGRNEIAIISLETFQVETRIYDESFHNVLSFCLFSDESFLSGNYGKFYHWNKLYERLTLKDNLHKDYINCIIILKEGEDKILATCSYDETVKIWKA